MSPSARKWMYVAVVTIPVALIMYYVYVVRTPDTALTIEITGGFAYVPPVPSDNHLNIAYLNSWHLKEDLDGDGVDDEACNVEQLGTDLMVTKGDIVDWEPKTLPKPPSKEFGLNNATVRIPAVEAANQTLTIGRDLWTAPPTEPVDPDKDDHWKNLKWVPSLKEYHGGSTIDPNWPMMVNGRLELRGGEIIGTKPSDPRYKRAHFDFQQNKVSKHTVSVTDKTIYTIDLPTAGLAAGNLELTLSYTNGVAGYTKLVIKPQGHKVELTLKGRHKMGDMKDGDELTDFCTFYQLLQPRPAAKDFLVPYYREATSVKAAIAAGAPSPGFFCNGDWF